MSNLSRALSKMIMSADIVIFDCHVIKNRFAIVPKETPILESLMGDGDLLVKSFNRGVLILEKRYPPISEDTVFFQDLSIALDLYEMFKPREFQSYPYEEKGKAIFNKLKELGFEIKREDR